MPAFLYRLWHAPAARFPRLIDEGKPIPVFGDGASARDYTFFEDTIQGIVAALHYESPFQVFNLGNSHPVDLNTLIATIEESLGKKANIVRMPDQPGDVPITFADISRAQKLLGYCPRTGFRQGIDRFVAWYRQTS